MLSLESHRHRAVFIGENLGTVPPEVNRSLRRHGIATMFVVQYEVRPQPSSALHPVPDRVVASLNTHDMPPFAAFWKGLDIPDHYELGLIKRGNLARERRLRERIRQSLAQFLRRRGRLEAEDVDRAVFRALVKHLGASDARWVLVNLEDRGRKQRRRTRRALRPSV
jgi:4-alpha-glucanotransferase